MKEMDENDALKNEELSPEKSPEKADKEKKEIPSGAKPPPKDLLPSLIDDSEEAQINAGYDDELDLAETAHPDEAKEAAEVEKVLNGDAPPKTDQLKKEAEPIAAATPEPLAETTAEPEKTEEAEAKVEPAPAEPESEVQAEPTPEAEAKVEPAPVEPESEVQAEPTPEVEAKVEPAPAEPESEVQAEPTPKELSEEKEPEPMVDYSLLSKEDVVKLFKEKLDSSGQENQKKILDAIRRAYEDKQQKEIDEKKAAFLEEEGKVEDFKPVDDPADASMREHLNKYKGLRAEHTRQLEKDKHSNLKKKQEILEGFRGLMEGQESFEHTFRRFKELQKEWFATGVVPHQNLKDLWDSYNYFVEKFNDYVRMNRDLRAIDLKKNLELKIQLCERSENLDKEENVVHAFRTLQKNHARWREIGPVPRENRDEVWERFKDATSVINRKHQEFHSRMKESLHENLEKKQSLCEQAETIASGDYTSHNAWASKTKEVLEIQKTWKGIGYAPKKDNNAIYSRFRAACDAFFGNKARFYSSAFEEQKDNLKLKQAIVEKAQSLSSSEEWKETTTELIRLQKEWKEIGPVPRRDSDKLWKSFRTACDTFFNNKSGFFKDSDSNFAANLEAKNKLLDEMDAFTPEGGKKEIMADLEGFQERYNKIGFVPSAQKDEIRERFRQAQDRVLENSGMDPDQISRYRFRNRIESIVNAPRAHMKLNFERDKLINKLQTLRNDISVWENNVGFFKQSDSSESTIAGYHERIEEAHGRIKLLEDKIRIIDDVENAN